MPVAEPQPDTPQPVTPQPVTPQPVTPQQVKPQPVTPQPVAHPPVAQPPINQSGKHGTGTGKGGLEYGKGKGGQGGKGHRVDTPEELATALDSLGNINPVFAEVANGLELDMDAVMAQASNFQAISRLLQLLLSIPWTGVNCSFSFINLRQLCLHQALVLVWYGRGDDGMLDLCRIMLAP